MRILSYNNIKTNSINKWFLLFLILYSGNGISFLNQNVTPPATILLLVVSFYWMFKNKVPFKGFIRLMIPWVIYCSISFVYFEAIRPTFFILLPASFFGVYVLMNSNINLKIIFNSFERIIFLLAKISLFFFSWQLLNVSSLISIFSIIDFNVGDSYNNLVYTIHHRSIAEGIHRNCGFCWEPGPFSCFLVLALIIYLFRTNLSFDRRVFIYTITILTTGSSTGYLCLLVIFIWYFYLKSKKYFILLLPIISAVVVLSFLNTSILKNKLFDKIFEAENELEFYTTYGAETSTSIGRFNGFLLNLKDFEKHPIIGFGGNFDATFSRENELNITSTNGLGNWLAQYGVVGFVFLIVAFYKSSSLIINLYETKGVFFLFIIYLIMSFAFNLMEHSMFILFFFGFFINRVKVLKY